MRPNPLEITPKTARQVHLLLISDANLWLTTEISGHFVPLASRRFENSTFLTPRLPGLGLFPLKSEPASLRFVLFYFFINIVIFCPKPQNFTSKRIVFYNDPTQPQPQTVTFGPKTPYFAPKLIISSQIATFHSKIQHFASKCISSANDPAQRPQIETFCLKTGIFFYKIGTFCPQIETFYLKIVMFHPKTGTLLP